MATLLSTQQLAGYLGYEASSVEKMRREGRGPAYIKTGRYVRYDPADVATWLELNKHNAPLTREEAMRVSA